MIRIDSIDKSGRYKWVADFNHESTAVFFPRRVQKVYKGHLTFEKKVV